MVHMDRLKAHDPRAAVGGTGDGWKLVGGTEEDTVCFQLTRGQSSSPDQGSLQNGGQQHLEPLLTIPNRLLSASQPPWIIASQGIRPSVHPSMYAVHFSDLPSSPSYIHPHSVTGCLEVLPAMLEPLLCSSVDTWMAYP